MKPVEKINFTLTPLKAEQKRQSKVKANQWCRHLKSLDEVTLTYDSHIDTYTACSQCGTVLNSEELKQRDIILANFKKLKK